MWGRDDLRRTRVYQEGQEEILEKTVPLLLEKGMTIEKIAQHFKLPIETIQQFASQNVEVRNMETNQNI